MKAYTNPELSVKEYVFKFMGEAHVVRVAFETKETLLFQMRKGEKVSPCFSIPLNLSVFVSEFAPASFAEVDEKWAKQYFGYFKMMWLINQRFL